MGAESVRPSFWDSCNKCSGCGDPMVRHVTKGNIRECQDCPCKVPKRPQKKSFTLQQLYDKIPDLDSLEGRI